MDLLGTSAFAISGALSAMNRRFDLFGIFIIAFVTAVGGGTIRDLLIGNHPVTWMESNMYIYLIGVVTIIAIMYRKQLDRLKKSLFLFDSIGLGVFTITGVELGIQNDLNPIMCMALGAITGTFGGVTRDILCNEIPIIFRKEIYATASLAGGFAFLVFYEFGVDEEIIYVITAAIVIFIRLMAVKFHISLPSFYLSEEKTPDI